MRVDLVDHNASDLKCVNAARVSYNTHHKELTLGDGKLVNAMIREGHGSVFEHSTFTFRIEAPIVVERQWFRHRAGHSYNEISGRYVEMEEKFHMPRPRAQEGKAMQYTYVGLPRRETTFAELEIQAVYDEAYDRYQQLLRLGIAKEVARYVLPQGLMTQWYWTCNARSLMHFLELRTAPDAQEEIRELAQEVEDIFGERMPITHQAFIENGRKAP